MIIKTATCLALAAACLAAIPAARAQTAAETVVVSPPLRVDPGDLNWNPQRNLTEFQQYDRLLETNPRFRMARIQKECGPITDPSAPPRVASSTRSNHRRTHYVGSSTAPRHYQSNSGR